MQFNWVVSATNVKGGFVHEIYEDKTQAHNRHNELYDELDASGFWRWSSIRTTRITRG